jgi:hypothetical protein
MPDLPKKEMILPSATFVCIRHRHRRRRGGLDRSRGASGYR